MVKEFDGKFPGIVAEYEIAVIHDQKVVTMLDIIDMDAFSALMSSPEMTAWDVANNNVDEIYALEKVN